MDSEGYSERRSRLESHRQAVSAHGICGSVSRSYAHGRRKRGTEGTRPPVTNLAGDVPSRLENEVAQIRCLFGLSGIGYFLVYLYGIRPPPLKNPWRLRCTRRPGRLAVAQQCRCIAVGHTQMSQSASSLSNELLNRPESTASNRSRPVTTRYESAPNGVSHHLRHSECFHG